MYTNHGTRGFYTCIREYGEHCATALGYLISIDTANFWINGPNEENIKVIRGWKWRGYKKLYEVPSVIVEDLNTIYAGLLNHFVFIDNGSLKRFAPQQFGRDFVQMQMLSGQEVFNASNEFEPLKIYRLKRTLTTTFSEKSNEKVEEKVLKTYWDVETLDHSKNVPCSRTNHSIAVNNAENCLYLFGGITKLVDMEFKHCPDKMRDPKFWQRKQLGDVWKLCLTTNTWEKVLDLYPESEPPSSESATPPFLIFNLFLIPDPLRDLIYGCYQKYSLKDDSEIIVTANVVCIDPIAKRFEEYSYQTVDKPWMELDNNLGRLYIASWTLRYKTLILINKKKLDAKARLTKQLLTPCESATIIHGPIKTATKPRRLRRWMLIIDDIIHGKSSAS